MGNVQDWRFCLSSRAFHDPMIARRDEVELVGFVVFSRLVLSAFFHVPFLALAFYF